MVIYFRSTIWRNYEDQILKAAVTKYGLNQWDRISSLLINKTSKQCKNRWFFWLNPKIKKNQWTYEEDERLIYLSYIFVSQWNTIGKFLGRTGESCAMRFEKLLNIRINNFNKPLYLEDTRNPYITMMDHDQQPAKMGILSNDHDLQNILVEARARLANIKGKKAKRKNKVNNIYYENFLQKEIFHKNLKFKLNYNEEYIKNIDSKLYSQKYLYKNSNNILVSFHQALNYKLLKKKNKSFQKEAFSFSNKLYKKIDHLVNKKKQKIISNFFYYNKYTRPIYQIERKLITTQKCSEPILKDVVDFDHTFKILKNKSKLDYFEKFYNYKTNYLKKNTKYKNFVRMCFLLKYNIPENFIATRYYRYFFKIQNRIKINMCYKLNKISNIFFSNSKYLSNKILWNINIKKNIKKRNDFLKKIFFKKCLNFFFKKDGTYITELVRKNMLNLLLLFNFLNVRNKEINKINKIRFFQNIFFITKNLDLESIKIKIIKNIFFNNLINIKKKIHFNFILNELYFFYIKQDFRIFAF
uniref:Cell division control protein, CDC5 n=1 Tax=Lotharella vacuolata TaxID=74820 RepID=A0A0H5BKV4_9EUKA|nr:cell division control protein, CDC5 [Lotharella vacuolata]